MWNTSLSLQVWVLKTIQEVEPHWLSSKEIILGAVLSKEVDIYVYIWIRSMQILHFNPSVCLFLYKGKFKTRLI